MNRNKGKPQKSGRRASTVGDIHTTLRQLILEGALRPGTVLSQIQLGKQLGVGRTPLREALRMLQQEGLIVAERNKRPQVVSFDPEVIEAVFAETILLSALATAVSVPSLMTEDLTRLERSLARMHQASERKEVEAWEDAHTAFHRGMIAGAGDSLLHRVHRLADDNRFYLRFLMTSEPVPWSAIDEEHGAMLSACRAGDGELAAKLLARHLASGALALLAHAIPEREPRLVRAAMRMVLPKLELITRKRVSGGANEASVRAVS